MKAAMRAVRRKSSFSSDHPAAPIQDEQHSTVPPLPASSPSLQFQPPGRTTPQLSDPARVSAFGMDAILAMAAVSSADSSLGRLSEVQEEPHPSPSPPPRQTTSPLYERVFGSSVVPESPPSQPTSVVNGRGGHTHVTSVERAGRPSTANSANTNSDYLSSSNSHHVQSRSADNHHRAGLAPTQPNLGAGHSDVSLTSYKSASTEYRSKFVEVESPEVQATHPAPATAKERKMSSDSKGRGRSASRQSGGGEDHETRGEQKEGEGKRRSFSLPRRSRSKQRSASDAPPSPSNPPPMPLPIGAQVPPSRTSNATRPTSTSPQPPSPSMPVQQQQYQDPHHQQRTSQAATLQQHHHQHASGPPMPAPAVNASRRASAFPPPASMPSPEKEKSGGGLFGRMRSGKKKSKDSAARDTHPSQVDARQAQSLGPASSGRVPATRQSMVPTSHSQPILNGSSHAQAQMTHDPRRKTSGSDGIVLTSNTGRSPVPVAQSVNSVSNENEAAAAKLRERLAVLAVKEQERGVALVAKEQERQAAELREQERVATLAVKEEQRFAALAAAQEAERSAAEAKEKERAERRARKEAAAAYEAELKQKTRAAALAAEVERVAAARRGAEAQAKMRQARNRTSVIQPDDAALPNARPASRPPPSQKRMSIVAGPQAQQRFPQAQPLVGNERSASQAAGPQSRTARSPVHNAGDLSSAESNIEPITPHEDDAILGHQNRSWSSDEPSKGPTGLARRSWSTRQPNGWAPGEVPAATGPVEQGMPPRAGLTDSPELDPMPEDDPDAVPGRPNSRFGLVIDASEKASVDLDREVAKKGKQTGSPFQSPQSRTSELAPSERSERDSQLLAAYRGQQPREYVQNITRRTIPAPSQLAGLPRSPSARYTFEEVTYHVCVPKLRRPSRSRRKVDAETDDGESVPSSPAQIVVDWRTEDRRVYVRYSDLFACLFTLASADLLEALIAPLEGLEIKTLRQTCVGVRRVLDGMQGRELVLKQFLSEHGYQTWRPTPLVAVQPAPGLGANTAPASPHAVVDPLPLSLTDLDSFLLGQDLLAEYPLVATSYIQTPQELDPRIPRLARASTRAYNRVVARLRIQPHFRLPSPPAPPQATSAPASPNLKRSPGNSPLLGVNKAQSRDARTNSYYPSTAANVQQGGSPGQSPAASPSLSPHRPGQRGSHNAEGLSPAVSTHSLNSVAASSVSSSSATPDPPAKVTPSLYRPGRAALFRVWVPSMDGLWLDDDEVAACEAEMFRAGVWGHLKPGDIVWDTAIGNVGNVGKMIFDGRYLRDLSYVFDPFGHLPSWVNAFHFSPSHFHNVIRSSTDQPIVFLDVLPWREAILTSLRLVQDRVDTPGRYRIARWVHRASFRIAPGQIVSAEGEGLEVVDEGWAGTIYVEADGTSEAARELVLRCAGPEPSAQLRAELISRAAHTADPNPNPLAPLPPLRLTGKEGERAETTSAWAILRERSRPGQIWIRPVTENRMTV